MTRRKSVLEVCAQEAKAVDKWPEWLKYVMGVKN